MLRKGLTEKTADFHQDFPAQVSHRPEGEVNGPDRRPQPPGNGAGRQGVPAVRLDDIESRLEHGFAVENRFLGSGQIFPARQDKAESASSGYPAF